jgi:uncharacterized membrane protein
METIDLNKSDLNNGGPNLQIGYLLARSWETFKAHWLLVIGVFLVFSLVTNGLPSALDQDSPLAALLRLIIFVIQGPLLAGIYWLTLRLIRGQSATFEQIFEGFQTFGRAFGVFVLYTLGVVVGLFLLILPGVFVAVSLMPAMFLVMDADLPVIDTLRRAWTMTKGYRLNIFIVFLVLLGLNLLGVLALIIGFIVTGAFSLLVMSAMYDELSKTA